VKEEALGWQQTVLSTYVIASSFYYDLLVPLRLDAFVWLAYT